MLIGSSLEVRIPLIRTGDTIIMSLGNIVCSYATILGYQITLVKILPYFIALFASVY